MTLKYHDTPVSTDFFLFELEQSLSNYYFEEY